MPKNKAKSKPKCPDTPCRCVGRRPSSCPQFWVIESGTDDMSEGTLTSHGPFDSQEQAEEWIKETSADDWIRSCGCLREGDREEWGEEYFVVQVVRSVRPVPPESVKMTLIDTANADVDLPDTAAQDSASKSNNPAVSG